MTSNKWYYATAGTIWLISLAVCLAWAIRSQDWTVWAIAGFSQLGIAAVTVVSIVMVKYGHKE